jgi:ASC-1-like (ASCH) protein
MMSQDSTAHPQDSEDGQILPRNNLEDKVKNTLLRVLGILDTDLKNISAGIKRDEGRLVIEVRKKVKDLETDLDKILHKNKNCKVVVNPFKGKTLLYELPSEVHTQMVALHGYSTSNETGELHEQNIESTLTEINKKLDEMEPK